MVTQRTNTRTLTQQATRLAQTLTHIATLITPTLTHALDWTPPGTTNSTGPAVATSNITDLADKITNHKTGNIKTRKDQTTLHIKAITHDIHQLHTITQRLHATLKQLQPIDHQTAQQLAETGTPNTGTECVNCHTWITGKGNDRPRAGRCDPCRQHLRRQGTERVPTNPPPPPQPATP